MQSSIRMERKYILEVEMAEHEKFNFKTLDELRERIEELKVDIQLDEDTSILSTPVKIKGRTCSNRFAVLPMEGCDSEADGSPSALVKNRYERFFLGGRADLIGFARDIQHRSDDAVAHGGHFFPVQIIVCGRGNHADRRSICAQHHRAVR